MKNSHKLISAIILFFFVPIIFFLYIHSILGTTVLNQFSEQTYYIRDFVWSHLIAFVLLAATGIILWRILKNYKLSNKTVHVILLAVTLVYVSLMSLYIWTLKWYPQGDQWDVYHAAFCLLSGDYTRWEAGGYLWECPNQTGIVLIYTLFHVVFGENAYLWIQQWNVICYVAGGIFLAKITMHVFQSRITALITYLSYLLFLPFGCYVTFVYGTIPGFALSIAALYFLLRFLKEFRLKWIFPAGALIAFAYLWKSNYLITCIALLCILLAGGIVEKKLKRSMLAAAVLVGNLLLITAFSHICIKSVTGMEVSKGTSAWGFIAMGMQESNRAPGWFNGYHLTNFRENGGDVELAGKEARAYIGTRVKEFAAQPAYFLEFYSKKISSQWNNPTFQGFWIQQVMSWYREDIPASVDEWIQDGGSQNRILTDVFNVVQSIVLLCCILFFFLHPKTDYKQLSLAVIFIGGFLFHLIWEAKCQYTVGYFVLLLPYAVQGMVLLGKRIWNLSLCKRCFLRKRGIAGAVAIFFIVLIITQNNLACRKLFKYYTDDEGYHRYVTNRTGIYHEWQNKTVE